MRRTQTTAKITDLAARRERDEEERKRLKRENDELEARLITREQAERELSGLFRVLSDSLDEIDVDGLVERLEGVESPDEIQAEVEKEVQKAVRRVDQIQAAILRRIEDRRRRVQASGSVPEQPISQPGQVDEERADDDRHHE